MGKAVFYQVGQYGHRNNCHCPNFLVGQGTRILGWEPLRNRWPELVREDEGMRRMV